MSAEDNEILWYAMRAYKSERRVEELMKAQSTLECFVAKRYELRTYHGIRLRKLVPLIPSLIFIRGRKSDIQRFKQKHQCIQYMGSVAENGKFKALVVPDEQMQAFIKVANEYESDVKYMNTSEVLLIKGSRVRIIGGTFDGVEGILLYDKEKNSNRVVVSLPDNLGSITTADISLDLIEVLND